VGDPAVVGYIAGNYRQPVGQTRCSDPQGVCVNQHPVVLEKAEHRDGIPAQFPVEEELGQNDGYQDDLFLTNMDPFPPAIILKQIILPDSG
jgi:hypothetical protein